MGIEPDKERRAPAAPTKLDFPAYNFKAKEGMSNASLQDLYSLLSSIKRPQDISPSRFEALNLSVESDLSASNIISEDRLASLPPLPWNIPVDTDAESPSTRGLMNNGSPYPAQDRYEVLRDELMLDNDAAFREVARLPPREGRQRVRITQTRKFWAGLERMAQYWDTSLDNYYDRPATPSDEPGGGGGDKMQTDDPRQSKELNRPDPMDVDQTEMVTMYTGRRTGAGHEMPEDIREETVRSFTEMAAWPFGCQASMPTLPPRLTVKTLLFPIRQSFGAARSPKDRQLARKGVMEGPLFVGQCRPETTFRNEDEEPGSGVGEVCDVYREVGAMLLAAQERAREGTTEVKPGEGKWWTTQPRWGGAPNDGIEGDANNSDEQATTTEDGKADGGNTRKRSKSGLSGSRRSGNGRRLSNSERWKQVQPGPSLWDKRMTYTQIGKIKGCPFDDVGAATAGERITNLQTDRWQIYLVSSINHHVAILHLRVHRRYLEILTTGESEFPAEEQGWDMLQLRRTRWYDLFDGQERQEAFRGVWSIFHYQMRS